MSGAGFLPSTYSIESENSLPKLDGVYLQPTGNNIGELSVDLACQLGYVGRVP